MHIVVLDEARPPARRSALATTPKGLPAVIAHGGDALSGYRRDSGVMSHVRSGSTVRSEMRHWSCAQPPTGGVYAIGVMRSRHLLSRSSAAQPPIHAAARSEVGTVVSMRSSMVSVAMPHSVLAWNSVTSQAIVAIGDTTAPPRPLHRPDVPTLRVHVSVDDGVVTITVVGHLDRDVGSALRGEFLIVNEACAGTLVVDLSMCTGTDTEGINILSDVYQRSRTRPYQLVVRATRLDIADAVATVGMFHAARDPVPQTTTPSMTATAGIHAGARS